MNFVKEYINRVVYHVYVILARRDKDKGKILMICFIFYLILNDKENEFKL